MYNTTGDFFYNVLIRGHSAEAVKLVSASRGDSSLFISWSKNLPGPVPYIIPARRRVQEVLANFLGVLNIKKWTRLLGHKVYA